MIGSSIKDLKLKKLKIILKFFLYVLIITRVIPIIYLTINHPEVEWDSDSIDAEDIHFPKSFSWGTATAALPDGIRNYMTKFPNDDWMKSKGFKTEKN